MEIVEHEIATQIITQLGFPIALVIYLLYRNREQAREYTRVIEGLNQNIQGIRIIEDKIDKGVLAGDAKEARDIIKLAAKKAKEEMR